MSKDSRQTFPTSGVRVISGMQYLVNPDTGDRLLTVEDLEHALASHASIRRWAFIIHEDSHVHWVAATSDPVREKRAGKQVPRRTWARWFGVPEDRIWRVLGGEDGLADVLIYMLHEGAAGQGKTHYSHDDMVASAGWDWEALVRSRQTALAVAGPGPGPRRQLSLRGRMLEEGLSYREARAQSTVADDKLRNLRHEYLRSTPPPETHTNIYIQGRVSPDRDALAKIVATQVAGGDPDDVFVVDNWADYDGESVLVLNVDGNMPRDLDSLFDGPLSLFRALSPATTRPVTVSGWMGDDHYRTRLHHTTVIIASKYNFDGFRRVLGEMYANQVKAQLCTPDRVAMSLPVFLPMTADEIGVQILARYDDETDLDPTSPDASYVHWARITNHLRDLRALPDGPDRRALERRQTAPALAARTQVEQSQHTEWQGLQARTIALLEDDSAWEV